MMSYDRNNLINLIKGDLKNYPCPKCNDGSFTFKDLGYTIGGPALVNVYCDACNNEQTIKFHLDII